MPGHTRLRSLEPTSLPATYETDSLRKAYVRQALLALDIYIFFWHTPCMAFTHPVEYSVGNQTLALALNTAQTFYVDMLGGDLLLLLCKYTYNAGTALTFTFESEGVYDPATLYQEFDTNYATGAAARVPVVVTLSAASVNFKLPIALTGVGMQGGRVKVTVTGTGTNASDTIQITPVAVRT